MFTSVRQRVALTACAVLFTALPLQSLAAGSEQLPDVDLAAIKPGHGVVFGSIDLSWPKQPLLSKGPGSKNKIIEIRRLDRIAAGKVYGDPDVSLQVRLNEPKPFLHELKAGGYMITCVYHADVLATQPSGHCYPVKTQFSVVEGELTYIGDVVIRMPPSVMSLKLDVEVVDRREPALAGLTEKYGEALAAAATRLATGSRDREELTFPTEQFPRLAAAMQRPEMIHSESKPDAYELVRYAIVGNSTQDWEIALEIMVMPRISQPRTPTAWLTEYRGISEQTCPGEWTILEKTGDGLTFERRTPDCPPYVAQQALYRLLYGQDRVFLLICTQEQVFDEQTREECRATLAGAAIVRN